MQKMDMDPADIIHLLSKAGFTQADIANQIGVSGTAVNRVIYGFSVSDRIRRAIADAVKKDIRSIWPSAYIFNGGPRKPGRPCGVPAGRAA